MTTTMPAVRTDGWDALLSDGGVVRIRPATGADEDRLRALHEAASDRSNRVLIAKITRLWVADFSTADAARSGLP
jgi:transcriptional regulator of nitric oxide reductase